MRNAERVAGQSGHQGSATRPASGHGFSALHNRAMGLHSAVHQGTAERAAPAQPAQHPFLDLQQQAGNQAMQQLLRGGLIRAKLEVSQPGDPEEQEADAVADRVMRSHAGVAVGASACGCQDEKSCNCSAGGAIARSAAGTAASAPPGFLRSIRGSGGHPLDHHARAFLEPRFGRDFSHIRVHSDSTAASNARTINAHAFTAGSDIFFGAGKYSLGTADGMRLLAHELSHTAQGQDRAFEDRLMRKYDDHYTLDPASMPAWNSLQGRDLDKPVWNKAFDATLSATTEAGLDQEKELQNTAAPVTDEEKEAATAKVRTLIRLTAIGLMASNRAGVTRKRDELLGQTKSSADKSGKKDGDQNLAAENAKAIRAAAAEAVDLSDKKEKIEDSERHLRMLAGSQMRTGGESFNEALKGLFDESLLYQSPDVRRVMLIMTRNLLSGTKFDRGMRTVLIFNMSNYLADWRRKQANGIIVAQNSIYEQFPFLAQLAPKDVPKEGEATDAELMQKVSLAFKDLIGKIDNAIIKIGAGDIDPFDLPVAVKATKDNLSADMKKLLAEAMVQHQVNQFWKDMGMTLAQVFLVFIPVVGPALAATVGIAQLASGVSEALDRYEVASASTSVDGSVLGVTGPSKLEWAMLGVQAALTAADLGALWKEMNAGRAHFHESEPRLVEDERANLGEGERESSAAEKDRNVYGSEHTGTSSEAEKLPGEQAEPLKNGGEARITEEGVCKICHSPCEREVQMARDLLDRASGTPYQGYVENLLKRIQALEDSMVAASASGDLKKLYNSRYKASFEKLSNEIDIAERKLSGGGRGLRHGSIDEIHDYGAGREYGIMDEPHVYDPERALEGTAFHEHIEDAVAAKLPKGSAYTENTIQDFLTVRGVAKKDLPTKSTGIDLYVIDRVRGVVTPVDITGVAGSKSHVGKMMKDADKMRAAFEKAGLRMAEPFEIEYAGATFAGASKDVVNELKALAQ